jgi:hypothetical protein
VHLLGGTTTVVDGRLVVALPPAETGADKLGVRLARVLYLAEAELVAVAKRGGEIDAERVPDRPLLPSGRVAP